MTIQAIYYKPTAVGAIGCFIGMIGAAIGCIGATICFIEDELECAKRFSAITAMCILILLFSCSQKEKTYNILVEDTSQLQAIEQEYIIRRYENNIVIAIEKKK